MSTIFRAGQPNFPANQAELDRRLREVEKLINNEDAVSQVNIKFSEAAFQLMQDCDLITNSNIRFLTDSQACQRFDPNFKFPFNPDEGALRAVKDDGNVLGADGKPRFYHGRKRHVELNGRHYLISNDWYADPDPSPYANSPYANKRKFYDWLKEKAQDACEKYWAKQKIVELLTTSESNNLTAPEEIPKPDDLKAVLASLEELHKKVDALNARLDNLSGSFNDKVDEVNKEVKALYELWK